MGRVIQISILGRVYGNVNANDVVGQLITIKKMYGPRQEVYPFVSARAIKRAIRDALEEMGHRIDPFIKGKAGKGGGLELMNSGRPDLYIDNDLFGYMYTIKKKGERGKSFRRQAPIAMSYFKAIRSTPVKKDFGARFPRKGSDSDNPVPFEVEVADFIGRLNVLIYDYIGDFTNDENEILEVRRLDDAERRRRLSDFLKVLLTPKYILPRRTNSLVIPEYIASLIFTSEKGPAPIYQYLDYNFEMGKVDHCALSRLVKIIEAVKDGSASLMLVDYRGDAEVPKAIEEEKLDTVIERLVKFMIP